MRTYLTTAMVLAAFLTLGANQPAQAYYYYGGGYYAPYHRAYATYGHGCNSCGGGCNYNYDNCGSCCGGAGYGWNRWFW